MGFPRIRLRPTTTASLPLISIPYRRRQAYDSRRCGGSIGGLAHCHASEAVAGDSIYIFLYCDAVEALALFNLFGNGMLKQNAADPGVGVQFVDLRQKLLSGCLFGKRNAERLHADAAAGIALHADVGCGRGVGPHENCGEDGRVFGPGFLF